MMFSWRISLEDTPTAAPALRSPSPPDAEPGKGQISVDNMTIIYGTGESQFLAVDRVSFHVPPGQFLSIVGPSGCGKSTLMNAIVGFEFPTHGSVCVDGSSVEGPDSTRGMVFQTPTLFPWKSIRQNVAHGPRMMGKTAEEADVIAGGLLEMVGLSQFSDNYPHTLSGGMQQRTAIARALANTPDVLLMDEPFGALDAQTRATMQENLLQIWSAVKATVVFVTHDIDEAIFLSDRILVMSASPGRIIKDIPVTLARPRNADITLDPAFMELKKECRQLIREESLRAFEQQADAARRQAG